jgi:precorrin-2 dehydrogenase / sirohydrochlorin ferrochelatase
MAALFPIFLKLENRRVLVVGAGNVGEAKIQGLLDSGAEIKVVSLRASGKVQEWASFGLINLKLRPFVPDDLQKIALAVIATSDSSLNQSIYAEAQKQGVLCNVVDVPHQCDFYYPAIVRRGDLRIAISTNGQSPFLAQRIRQELEQLYGPIYAEWVAELGAIRREVLQRALPPDTKRQILRSAASRQAFDARAVGASDAKGDAA